MLHCCCRLVQWCHGAAGMVALMVKCEEVFGPSDGSFLAAARQAADLVWERGLLKKVRCGLVE
jgi:hypothetical protein